jgi:hypothetical protein
MGQLTTATLAGAVTDSTGAMPGATVTLISQNTQAKMSQVSSGTGEFVFASVPGDTYMINISLSGFKNYELSGRDSGVGSKRKTHLCVEVGAVTENHSDRFISRIVSVYRRHEKGESLRKCDQTLPKHAHL